MRPAITLLATALLLTPALAEDGGDEATCRTGQVLAEREAACTRLVDTPGLAPARLVLALEWRSDAIADGQRTERTAAARRARRERAVADLDRALALNPRALRALFSRAMIRSADDPEAAIADYTALVAINPRSTHGFNNRGVLYRNRGDYDRALADFDETLQLTPTDWFGLINRGRELGRRGRFEPALVDLDAAVAQDFNRPSSLIARADVYALKGDTARAIVDYDAILALQPKNDRARRARAGLAAAGTPSTPSRRIALVIGNGGYRSFPQLPNPPNDARDVAGELKRLGFEVALVVDGDRSAMESSLATFARGARTADAAVIFYAGHGLQYQDTNYLVPVDAQLTDETDLRRMITVQGMLHDLQSAPGARILMLDACRDSGGVRQLAARATRSRGAPVGATLREDKAEGVLIAYATLSETTANDGEGRNSPFTTALLRHLPTPQLELRTMLTRVRRDVLQATGGRQRPEVSDSLDGEFDFKP